MTRKEQLENRLFEMTKLERDFWSRGLSVAGIDEVGRGPLAGPVVTACVVMPEEPLILGINDSKKLSSSRREALYDAIMEHALYIGIGRCDQEEIDRINILNATKKAMQDAFETIEFTPDIVLIDAVDLKLPCQVMPIIHGDAKSYSIAAASIVAKVTRDRMMVEQHAVYPQYGFDRHKGYGTKEHIACIREYGPCQIHRKSFLKGILYEPAGEGKRR